MLITLNFWIEKPYIVSLKVTVFNFQPFSTVKQNGQIFKTTELSTFLHISCV